MITFQWFGPRDQIPLAHIRQIPAVRGIVGALFDIPVGERWPLDRIAALRQEVERYGLPLAVIESIPVHEDIKLGRPTRDTLLDNYCESVRNVGRAGVRVVCYNFMPVFDWMRTDLLLRLDDGSTALAYDDSELAKIDLSRGTADLPGWATAYTAEQLRKLLDAYRLVNENSLWENLAYFLERVIPAAASSTPRILPAVRWNAPSSPPCSPTRASASWSTISPSSCSCRDQAFRRSGVQAFRARLTIPGTPRTTASPGTPRREGGCPLNA